MVNTAERLNTYRWAVWTVVNALCDQVQCEPAAAKRLDSLRNTQKSTSSRLNYSLQLLLRAPDSLKSSRVKFNQINTEQRHSHWSVYQKYHCFSNFPAIGILSATVNLGVHYLFVFIIYLLYYLFILICGFSRTVLILWGNTFDKPPLNMPLSL